MSTAKPKLKDLLKKLRNELTREDVQELLIMLEVKGWRNLPPEYKLVDAMNKWLEFDPEASWEKLVNALKDIDKNALAESLKKEYCSNTAAKPQPDTDTTGMHASDQLFIVYYLSFIARLNPPVGSSFDMILTEANADEILEKLLPDVEECLHTLGQKLLPTMDKVNRIIQMNVDNQEKLRWVITTFLKQKEPKPTWRRIVEALSSHSVNLQDLATKLKRAHCPSLEEQKESLPGKYVIHTLVFLLFLHSYSSRTKYGSSADITFTW